jgi:hypothetical protein
MVEEPVVGRQSLQRESRDQIEKGWTVVFSLGFVTILLLWLGLYPGPLMDFIRVMLGPMVSSIASSN